MLGADAPDEFPEFNGWRPPIGPRDVDEFDLEDAQQLLDEPAVPGGHGGHAHGGSKPDTFPTGWTAVDVLEWVEALVESPVDGHRGLGRFGSEHTAGFSLFGSHRGVDGVLRIRDSWGVWMIATAHPFSRLRWRRELERVD